MNGRMKMWVVYTFAVLLIVLATLAAWRQFDRRADAQAWNELVTAAGGRQGSYDVAMVSDLPEPARRYFNYMIEPGTALYTAVELHMTGQIGRGTREAPGYRAMQAQQILAPPHGLVWQLESGPLSGSDAALPAQSWTRFWLFGVFPVVRAGGPDHRRSAFGRIVAEAAMWAPASLLPSEHVRWEALDANSAQAVLRFGDLVQAVDITVDESGAPSQVVIQRWSNENAEATFREQPFGGELSEFRRFGGYRLPTRVEGGNHFGTPDYFPFFIAEIGYFRFPAAVTP